MVNHGSLFSGIGGFDLAAQWMGWENIFHCEWNEFGQKVLKYYWPRAISYHDITKTDFTIHRGDIDILTGGFPCQPYSTAGKRLGKEDDRHLWPEMLRAIREIQPRYVVGENVSGLVNWNGGMVFEEVQADLEAEGYEVRPFILPACAVNAPHRRDRVWFVAYAKSYGNNRTPNEASGEIRGSNGDKVEQSGERGKIWSSPNPASDRRKWEREGIEAQEGQQSRPKSTGIMERRFEGLRFYENVTNPNNPRFQEEGAEQQTTGLEQYRELGRRTKAAEWEDFPTQSPVCFGDDGLSRRLDAKTILNGKKPKGEQQAFNHWRNESIKAGGNAIVPQVAIQIFKAIESFMKLEQNGES